MDGLKMPREEFFRGKYAEYQVELDRVSPCVKLMEFGWFDPPSTIRLDSKFGRQQMVFVEFAEESARDLASGINRLIGQTLRLEAWQRVIQGLDDQQKLNLMFEFVQDTAVLALLTPYTLKSRFSFATARLSHQANSVKEGAAWSDDLPTLGIDASIDQDVAVRLSKKWGSWKRFIRALNDVDDNGYKKATREFRNKQMHRFEPRIELGVSETVSRASVDGGLGMRYGLGGRPALTLVEITAALRVQCVKFAKCYSAFQQLVREQCDALFEAPDA